MRAHIRLLPAFLLGNLACGGAGVGVEFATGALTAGSVTEVTRFEIQVRELKILPDNSEVDEKLDKFKAKGEFLINVLDPEASTIPSVDLEDGIYKKVEFKIDKPDAGGGIDGSNASLLLEATKDGVSVRLLVEKIDKVTVRDVTGITLPDDADGIFVVDLSVGDWFDGVDLPNLTQDSGVVVIDKDGANKAVYGTVVGNIQAAIKLARKP